MMRNLFVVLATGLTAAAAVGLVFAQARGPASPPSDQGAPVVLTGEKTPPPPGPRPWRPGEGERGERTDRDDHHTGGSGAVRVRVPPIFRDVTEEQIADILKFLGEYMPWLREDLEKMRQSEPDRFRQVCRRLRFEVAQLRSLKERDEAAFRKAIEERQLRMRGQDLAAKIRAAADPREKESLTGELRKVLGRLFDAEMVTREANIKGLSDRLDALRRELRDRADHRQEIIQKRLDDALKGDPDSIFAPPPERDKPKDKEPKPDTKGAEERK